MIAHIMRMERRFKTCAAWARPFDSPAAGGQAHTAPRGGWAVPSGVEGRARWIERRFKTCATFGLALVLAVSLCSGCGRRTRPPAAQPHRTPDKQAAAATKAGAAEKGAPGKGLPGGGPPAGAHAEVKGGEIVVASPEGARLWRASAAAIEWDYDKQQAVLHDVNCVFTEKDKPTLEAQAPLVKADIKRREVVLEDGVTARSLITRTSLRADRMEWKAKDKEVYATGNVKYARGDFVITGERLRADLALKRARLVGGVQMRAVEPFKGK